VQRNSQQMRLEVMRSRRGWRRARWRCRRCCGRPLPPCWARWAVRLV